MKVIFAPAAEVDLDAVGDHIAQPNPVRAMSFVEELYSACLAIGNVPFGATILPGYQRQGYRRKPYCGYLLIYRVLDDGVEIVRVLQGSRDIDRVLRSGEP